MLETGSLDNDFSRYNAVSSLYGTIGVFWKYAK